MREGKICHSSYFRHFFFLAKGRWASACKPLWGAGHNLTCSFLEHQGISIYYKDVGVHGPVCCTVSSAWWKCSEKSMAWWLGTGDLRGWLLRLVTTNREKHPLSTLSFARIEETARSWVFARECGLEGGRDGADVESIAGTHLSFNRLKEKCKC